MSSFDIKSLLDFSPPNFFCQKCRALLVSMPINYEFSRVSCTVCGVDYLATESNLFWNARQYFESGGRKIEFKDTMAQSRALAVLAQNLDNALREPGWIYPMQVLLEALNAAQAFIHFMTYGMSLQLVGALRMAALHVPVRGIVANASPAIAEELKTYAKESPHLETHLYERSDKRLDWDNMPHQKVIIIDGLLAFKGSANLTVDGWRKAAKGLDSVDVVTDVNEVIALNNRLFSPVWAKEDDTATLLMTIDDVPF
ncbi:MAG TPA: phospholipase D-like domain-containing protein [Ktedonobacterales bacterium]|nr:phospholipase D-like domain-containing protein [Ktedonobacterales bacterium]